MNENGVPRREAAGHPALSSRNPHELPRERLVRERLLRALRLGAVIGMFLLAWSLGSRDGDEGILVVALSGLSLPAVGAFVVPRWAGFLRRTSGVALLVAVCAYGLSDLEYCVDVEWYIFCIPILGALAVDYEISRRSRQTSCIMFVLSLALLALAFQRLTVTVVSRADFDATPVLILALACGLVSDLFLSAGLAARTAPGNRRWSRLLVPSLILLPTATAWASWLDIHEPRVEASTRMSLALEIYSELSTLYPHWEDSGVDQSDLWSRYRPRLLAADRVCGDNDDPCVAYLHALRDMFAELSNGHTVVVVYDEVAYPLLMIEPVESRPVITAVGDGVDPDLVGMTVLAVDGQPVEEALQDVPAYDVAHEAARSKKYEAHRRLLKGPSGTEVSITVELEGERRMLRFPRVALYGPADDDDEDDDLDGICGADWGPGMLTEIHLKSIDGMEVAERFESVLEEVLDARGLVLDLRDNGGGSVEATRRVIGHFLTSPLRLGEDCYWSETDGEREQVCVEYDAEPTAPTYEGPVAVLINENVASSGEILAFALCASGRARCFGRATAGETDCVIRREIPGALVGMSSADFRPAFGPPLLGRGVHPDVHVEWTVDDLIKGRDPDYEAAEAWLRDQAVR